MWSAINTAVTGCFDLLLWPFAWAPVWLQLAVMAVPAGIATLLAVRFCSSQTGRDAAKSKIVAYLLELWIYRDDLKVSLLAQARFVGANLRYLGHWLAPLAVAGLPIVLMWVQVEARYRWRSIEPGETTVLTVELESEVPSALDVTLELPEGLTRETPALRVDSRSEIKWRLRADTPGEYEIRVRVGDWVAGKRAVVDANGTHASPQILRADDPLTLGNPFEAPLASDGPVRSVTLEYRTTRGEFLEVSSAGWLWTAFIFFWAFVLRGTFGVTF